jgi:predicted RNase H-like HicB family nuclease
MDHYPAKVFWYEPDSCFVAVAPDLPGCCAGGATRAEALVELQNAIDAWLQAAAADGRPVPQPAPQHHFA